MFYFFLRYYILITLNITRITLNTTIKKWPVWILSNLFIKIVDFEQVLFIYLTTIIFCLWIWYVDIKMQIIFACSRYKIICLQCDIIHFSYKFGNISFISHFYSILWSFLAFACFGSFDIKLFDEFADELLEESETIFVSVFLLLCHQMNYIFLSDFKRLSDFFLFQGMFNKLIFLLLFKQKLFEKFSFDLLKLFFT